MLLGSVLNIVCDKNIDLVGTVCETIFLILAYLYKYVSKENNTHKIFLYVSKENDTHKIFLNYFVDFEKQTKRNAIRFAAVAFLSASSVRGASAAFCNLL